jgi:hypothetical protein
VELGEGYREVKADAAVRLPVAQAPPQPSYLSQSPVMISSLPSIATAGDGITRQFYGTNLPKRRLMLP